MTKKIGVGIIGAGGWAQTGHIPALQFLDQYEVVAISSRTLHTAESIASRFGIPHAFDNPQTLIDHPNVDLVVVPTPPHERPVLVKQVIAAGKDVLTEWPLTTSTADSEELLALAEAAGVRHVVAIQRRFGPTISYLRDLIRQGYLGEIRSARLHLSSPVFGPTRPRRLPGLSTRTAS